MPLIPSAAEVRDMLQPYDTGAMRALAQQSGVPFTTLWKVKAGVTRNPGIETVRAFIGYLSAPAGVGAAAHTGDAHE